jgi:flavodoxin
MASTIIIELIAALDQEINAIKKGKGVSIVKVFNGRFLREVSGLFVYVFNLENFLIVLDDSPAEIEIRGNRYQAHVLLTKGLEIEIGIERFCDQYVPEAILHTNQWYLLELLKKRLIELHNGGIAPVRSEALLSGRSFPVTNFTIIVTCEYCGTKNRVNDCIPSQIPNCSKCKHELKPYYSLSSEPPNASQKQAINASFFSQLAVIWGPPGTGKTKTIAQAIEAHLNAGRRVLLVSHANAAVDEALEDVADQLRVTPFYNEGKLVRLGIPQSSHLDKLTEKFPLVLLDKIAEKLGESLSKEKHNLEKEKTRLESILIQYDNLLQHIQAVRTFSSELNAHVSEMSDLSGKFNVANSDLIKLHRVQIKNKTKLNEAQSSGVIKNFFRGLDPHKIQRKIDQTTFTIDSKIRLLKEISDRLQILKELRTTKEQKIKSSKNKANNLLTCMRVSVAEVETKKKEMTLRKDYILERLNEINQQLDEIQKKILSEARLIATTLTKTFTAKQFPKTPFDVLILDEASMAPLPHVYWAVSRCRRYVTIVGDFLQLPPICIADEDKAQKWLSRSLFSVLSIDQVKKAAQDGRVTLLDIQYRMAPEISLIPNKFFYQNMLRDDPSTSNRRLDDGVSKSRLVLMETGAMNPWCSRLSTGSRFNLYNALLCCTLAKKIISKIANVKIGIITPYVAQARLINKISKDWEILDHIRTSTVHRFQGGEESIIIFDTVEGTGIKVAPMLDDKKPDSDARRLLNVGLTRAKYRLYLARTSRNQKGNNLLC